MDKKTLQKYVRDFVRARPRTVEAVRFQKRRLATKYHVGIIANSVILEQLRVAKYPRTAEKSYKAQQGKKAKDRGALSNLTRLLRKREIRTLSGVAPITVLTKPYPCPGRCTYCPTEARMPKSYLASEPAAQRALTLKFDPYAQMAQRIAALEANGHSADKIELIVLGGTWSYYQKKYQDWFIKRCFDAANETTDHRLRSTAGKRQQTIDCSLQHAQRINETAKHRIIGLTLETRPDYVTAEELWNMRRLGCTHVQVGVQTLDQHILDFVKRDDSVANVARATAMLRDFGYKITYHLMPGLPGATPEGDYQVFKKIFSEPGFQPDMLKIYPCVVVKSAQIYSLYKAGKYKPYKGQQLIKLLARIKKDIIPPYVRINRLIRDIPGTDIVGGNLVTNLRQIMQNQGFNCQCIRCREARASVVRESEVQLVTRTYRAGQGTEHFISFENKDRSKLYAFTRLRLPDRSNRKTERLVVTRFFDKKKIVMRGNEMAFPPDTALIRELHTYGELIPVGSKQKAVQHIGFGKRLLAEAERLAKEAGYKKLAVISGIGVRAYYRKLGYRLEKTYMVKRIVISH